MRMMLEVFFSQSLSWCLLFLGDCKVLMRRDPTFPGISPRLEFSTRTKISECSEEDLFQSLPVRVITRKRPKSSRHQGCFSAPGEMPSSRSLSPFRSSGSSWRCVELRFPIGIGFLPAQTGEKKRVCPGMCWYH
ncbi:hypothetical protein AMELA_G00064610 [Ameiurus melas]|uniref:Secreted protein n=1 Tax=Ameiurus melas TaxID=219545 RepID=A0A7J6B2F9_AMEME|nr:hypothetical protein AMELA_G00064610 [Ameiurus melas]